MTYTTNNEEETRKVASRFAKQLKGGELVALVGDLGSGKTTFVRGVVEALGSKVRVKSPTFTVMNEYPIPLSSRATERSEGVEGSLSIRRIVHVDLYRFSDPQHLSGIELEDSMREDTVVFVEWPDIFGKLFVKPDHEVRFEFVDEETREIEMV